MGFENRTEFGAESLKKQKQYTEQDADQNTISESAETVLYISQLLDTLSSAEREIVLLKAYGYSHKEIADILKRPAGTVRWSYAAAQKKLHILHNAEDGKPPIAIP